MTIIGFLQDLSKKFLTPPPTAISRNIQKNIFIEKETFKHSSTYFKIFMVISILKNFLWQKVV